MDLSILKQIKRKHLNFPQETVEKRFWRYVNIRSENECWEWVGAKNGVGYGKIEIGKKLFLAHRLSYGMKTGVIPRGIFYGSVCVCHSCDNPSCVNPKHLFLGTQKDNIQDMINKNRKAIPPSGEECKKAKLTEKQVRLIRYWYSLGNMTYVRMAKFFEVSIYAIYCVVKRKTWKHV